MGVQLDQNLSFNEHIVKTSSNCMHKLVQINRIKHLLDRKTLMLLINAFVFSKLFYCSTVWSNTCKTNVKKLQLVQNFAARILLGLKKFDHISQGLKSLNWLPVSDRILVNDAIMVYKCLHNLVPEYLAGKLKKRSEVHNRQTRFSNDLNLPFCSLSTGQCAFAYHGAKLWNSIDSNKKNATCPKTFKRCLLRVVSW